MLYLRWFWCVGIGENLQRIILLSAVYFTSLCLNREYLKTNWKQLYLKISTENYIYLMQLFNLNIIKLDNIKVKKFEKLWFKLNTMTLALCISPYYGHEFISFFFFSGIKHFHSRYTLNSKDIYVCYFAILCIVW